MDRDKWEDSFAREAPLHALVTMWMLVILTSYNDIVGSEPVTRIGSRI
jgi:hypothetical protein